MLDLNFVRDNLPQVEEKLRQRGMNPAEVLKDFVAIDGERRQAITASETLQAQRNRASEEIAKLKKSGQDASAQISETKNLREQIQESEKKAAEQEARLRELLTAIPNLPNDTVPVGKTAEDNVEARRWGTQPQFDFKPKPHWSEPPNYPERDLPCTGHWAPALSALSPTSCSTCTPASMDTRKCFHRFW